MTWVNYLRDRYYVAADPLRIERRMELLVLFLGLLFALQLVYSALRLSFMAVPEAILPAADSLQVISGLSVETVTDEQSKEVLSRPLFWVSRRPVEAAGAIDPALEAIEEREIESIRLVGVFASGGSAGIIALVKGEKRRVQLGEEVEGWRLDSVSAKEVVFTAQARQKRLVLQPGAGNDAGVGSRNIGSERER